MFRRDTGMKKYNSNSLFPKFCFGCESLGGADWGVVDIKHLMLVVSESVALGVNFFDVADCYGLGLAETRLSKALGPNRHNVLIATKGGVRWEKQSGRAKTWIDVTPSYIKHAFFASLKRLHLEQIPVYFLHYPGNDSDFKASLELLASLKEKQLIRFVGVSNVGHKELEIALKILTLDIIQIPVNILNRPLDKKIQKLCSTNGIRVVSYNSLASGLLSGKYNQDSVFALNDRRSRRQDFSKDSLKKQLIEINNLKQTAKLEELSLAQYAIKELHNRYIELSSTIIGIKSREQLIHNLHAYA